MEKTKTTTLSVEEYPTVRIRTLAEIYDVRPSQPDLGEMIVPNASIVRIEHKKQESVK